MADQTALTRNPTARALTASLFPAGRTLPAADAEALLTRVGEHALLARALRLGLLWHVLDIVWIGIFSVVYLGGLA